MRNFCFNVIIVALIITLSSCQSRATKVIRQLDALTESVENNGKNFSPDEWKAVLEECNQIYENVEECDFSSKERKVIKQKEDRLTSVLLREGGKALGSGTINLLQGLGTFAEGFLEGSNEEYEERGLEDLGNNLMEELNNILGD